jgi:hypothetical protein
MKPAEIVLRRGGRRENDERDKSKIYCKHVCKCPPHTTISY